MFLKKGYFFRLLSKNKIIVLNFCLVVLIFCSVFAKINGENVSNNTGVYLPIENVETEKAVYSIIVSINGDENEKDIMLLSQLLKGLKIKSTFFINSNWIEDNKSLFNKVKSDGHNFGLQINNSKSFISRDDAIYYLASENDSFYRQTGEYSSFVRIEKDKSGKISELIKAFGQINVFSSITHKTEYNINCGDIISISDVDSNTPYDVAEFIGKCSHNNFTAISLMELLNLNSEEISVSN